MVSQLASGIRTDADAEGGLFPGFIGEIDAADLQSLRAAVEASKFHFFEGSQWFRRVEFCLDYDFATDYEAKIEIR